MNIEQQQIIDEAFKNYTKEYEKDNSIGMSLLVARVDGKSTYRKLHKEMFEGLIRADKTFSEKWGLRIEERGLSLEERLKLWYQKNQSDTSKREMWESDYVESYDYVGGYEGPKKIYSYNVPTKLITITYNDTKIESYE